MHDKYGENLEPAALPDPHDAPVVVSLISDQYKYLCDKKEKWANETNTDANE